MAKNPNAVALGQLGVRVTAEAPHGFVWTAGKVHELVAEGRGGRAATLDAQRDVRERIAFGLRPCEAVDCDWCEGL